MPRWWSAPGLLCLPVLLHLGVAPASASIHCNVTIIMSTLGTDGTSTVEANSTSKSLSDSSSSGVTGSVAVPGNSVSNNSPSKGSGGSGGGSGGGAGASGTKNNPASAAKSSSGSAIPTGATGNDEPTIPVPTSTDPTQDPGEDTGPVPPPPPVLDPGSNTSGSNETDPPPDTPIPPVVDDGPTIPVPTGVAETPEPGTLTLLAIGAIGGCGYLRKRRRA